MATSVIGSPLQTHRWQIILCTCALLLRRGEDTSDGAASAVSAAVLMGANVVVFGMVARLNVKRGRVQPLGSPTFVDRFLGTFVERTPAQAAEGSGATVGSAIEMLPAELGRQGGAEDGGDEGGGRGGGGGSGGGGAEDADDGPADPAEESEFELEKKMMSSFHPGAKKKKGTGSFLGGRTGSGGVGSDTIGRSGDSDGDVGMLRSLANPPKKKKGRADDSIDEDASGFLDLSGLDARSDGVGSGRGGSGGGGGGGGRGGGGGGGGGRGGDGGGGGGGRGRGRVAPDVTEAMNPDGARGAAEPFGMSAEIERLRAAARVSEWEAVRAADDVARLRRQHAEEISRLQSGNGELQAGIGALQASVARLEAENLRLKTRYEGGGGNVEEPGGAGMRFSGGGGGGGGVAVHGGGGAGGRGWGSGASYSQLGQSQPYAYSQPLQGVSSGSFAAAQQELPLDTETSDAE